METKSDNKKPKEINREDLEKELKLINQKASGLLGRINETKKLLEQFGTEYVKLDGEKRVLEKLLNVKV
jgi:hypothetical protein